MKIKLLIVCVFSIVFVGVKAQAIGGIKGGLNLSNMFIDEVNDEDMKVGFNAGFFVRSYMSDLVSLQAEANFTTKGSTVMYDYLVGEGVTDYQFNYLEFPLLLGIELGDIARIQAGPYGAVLLGGHVENNADDDVFDFNEPIDKDDFHIGEFGMAIGGSFGSDAFEIGLRYDYGLSEIGKTDNNNGLSYSLRNAHHSVWQATVAFGL